MSQVMEYDIRSQKSVVDYPSVLTVSRGEIIDGYQEILAPGLGNCPDIDVSIYKITPPSIFEERWLRTGKDVYKVSALFWQDEYIDLNSVRIYWRLDNRFMEDVGPDQYYAIKFSVVGGSATKTIKTGAEIIIHIDTVE